MNRHLSRFLLVVIAATSSGVGFAQRGGGQGGTGGTSSSNPGFPQEESLAGTWTVEFELDFDANDPEATGRRTTVRADVTVIGTEVNGRFRNPAEGEFNCTILQGAEHCYNGRLLIVWPGEDVREVAEFEFTVDRIDLRHAKGEARFLNRSGAIRIYSVEMDKR